MYVCIGEAHCSRRLLHRRKLHKPSLCCDRASNANYCDKRNDVHSSFKKHLYVLVLLFLVGSIGNKTLPTRGCPKTTGWPHALGGPNWLGTAGVPSLQQSHGPPRWLSPPSTSPITVRTNSKHVVWPALKPIMGPNHFKECHQGQKTLSKSMFFNHGAAGL